MTSVTVDMAHLLHLVEFAPLIRTFIRTFIRHKDRQYKIETETDRIMRKLKKRTIPHKKIKTY